ncbi:ABC transporter substrate-binding protein [Roseovarius rhodophyticola]|uniref:ABC transporter substrate-binding protein n=1 Tax=Roseovarius rhodophyticola TaxID=3080827 RepID=A0ABZ2TLH2_9RHOB|nr:ABC transporter substrate-binding protein [Roseovarius sp. W115]MDV2927877.1 ABC transporter substrate-binding protein [Roseovarius sp. W115]
MTKETPTKIQTSRRNFLRGAGAVTGSAAMLAGLNSTASAQEGDPIIIGCPAPLTGIVAADGIEFRNGLEMAAEEINQAGGILGRPVELVFVDTESKGDDVVIQAAQRLVDRNNVSAIITGYNLETGTAIHDIAADAGILYLHAMTVAVHDELVKSDPDRFWGTFQIDPPETMYGDGFLKYLGQIEEKGEFKRPNNKLAIINGPGTYSGNIANAINEGASEYGYEISLFDTVKVPVTDWGPTLAKLRADPPAVIAITHFYPQDQAQFMNQFMADPTDSLVYLQYGASLAAFRDIAGENSVGTIYATVIGALQDDIGNAFSSAYKAKFGDNSSPNSGGQTYQALHAYAVAAALAGGPGAPYDEDQNRAVAERMHSLIYRGPMGTLRIHAETQSAASYPNETNDPSLGMPHVFSQIHDPAKEGVLIAPAPYDKSPFQTPPWMKS